MNDIITLGLEILELNNAIISQLMSVKIVKSCVELIIGFDSKHFFSVGWSVLPSCLCAVSQVFHNTKCASVKLTHMQTPEMQNISKQSL